MATGFKRETMIALRARRSAHRIACDFLYPHVETPAMPEPALPLIDEKPIPPTPDQREVDARMFVVAIVLWTLTGLILYFEKLLHL